MSILGKLLMYGPAKPAGGRPETQPARTTIHLTTPQLFCPKISHPPAHSVLSQTVIKSKLNRRGFFGAVGGAVVGAMLALKVRPIVAAVEGACDAMAGLVVPNPAYVAAPYEAAFLVADGALAPWGGRPPRFDAEMRQVAPQLVHVGDGTVREHWPVVAPQDVAPLAVLHRDYNLTVRRRAVGGQFV